MRKAMKWLLISLFSIFCVWLFSPILLKLFMSTIDQIEVQRHQTDVQQIQQRFIDLCESIKTEEYSVAYSLMAPEFQSQHSLNAIKASQIDSITSLKLILQIQNCSVAQNRKFVFAEEHSKVDFFPNEQSYFSTYLVGLGIEMVKLDNEWYFTGNSDFYLD